MTYLESLGRQRLTRDQAGERNRTSILRRELWTGSSDRLQRIQWRIIKHILCFLVFSFPKVTQQWDWDMGHHRYIWITNEGNTSLQRQYLWLLCQPYLEWVTQRNLAPYSSHSKVYYSPQHRKTSSENSETVSVYFCAQLWKNMWIYVNMFNKFYWSC